MRKIYLFLCVALVLPHCLAQRTPPAPAPWKTGAQLLRQLAIPAKMSDSKTSKKDDIGAYLRGVHDATEGHDWCYTNYGGKSLPKLSVLKMKSHILTELRKMPPDQLRRNAAELVVEIWQLKWPCPPEGCCHD